MNGRQAAELAARGWYVFPCRPDGKRPLAAGWQQRATCDPDEVMQTWPGRWCNAGIACGPSRLAVADLDPPDGRANIEALGHEIPATFTVSTPREGGEHLYFTAIPGRVIRNSAGKVAPHVDVRGAGGFIVAPGSVVDGKPYTVTDDRDPVPMPGWLAELAAPRQQQRPDASQQERPFVVASVDRYGAGALRREIARIEEAPRGTRNDQLNRSAYALYRLAAADLLEEELVTASVRAAADRCGLTGDDGGQAVERTIESARTAGLAYPHARRPA